MRAFTSLTTKILLGAARSAAIDLSSGRVRGLTIVSPATLPETVNLEVSVDYGVSYEVLQVGGANLAFVAARALYLDYAGFTHIRFFSTLGNAAADRAFQVGLVEEI